MVSRSRSRSAKLSRIKNVRRLVDEIAREKHAFDDRFVFLGARLRGRRTFHNDLDTLQRRLLLGLQLRAVRVETIRGETRPHRGMRAGFRLRDAVQPIGLQHELFRARGQRAAHRMAGPAFHREAVGRFALANADHQHPAVIHTVRREHVDDLTRAAREARSFHCFGDTTAGFLVEGLPGLEQVAAFACHNRHNIAAAGGHKTDVHEYPLGLRAGRPLQPRSAQW